MTNYRLKFALATVLFISGGIWAITHLDTPEAQNKPFGAVLTAESRIADIKAEQTEHIKTNPRYKQFPEESVGTTKISITEYDGPQGIGYQIIAQTETETSTIIHSEDMGPEGRMFEYTIPKTAATSTPAL